MTASAATLTVRTLGLVPYREGLRLQDECVRARADGESGDTLLLLEHPPVLTAGRGTGEGSVKADAETLARTGLEVVPVSRGGDVTWHGPGQLIGYPICDVAGRDHDLHRFLRGLEQGLLDSLQRWGVDAHRTEGRTGVWVGERKLASIGIAVRRWVTYHGFALNVRPDLSHFELIHPCGLQGVRMTSMAELLGPSCPAWSEVLAAVSADVALALGYESVRGSLMAGLLEDANWSDTALGPGAMATADVNSGAHSAPRPGGIAA